MEKLQEKATKNDKISSQQCSHNKNNERVENPKTKRPYTLQNILFVKDSLTNEGMTSFNKIFQQYTTTC